MTPKKVPLREKFGEGVCAQFRCFGGVGVRPGHAFPFISLSLKIIFIENGLFGGERCCPCQSTLRWLPQILPRMVRFGHFCRIFLSEVGCRARCVCVGGGA